MLNRLKSKLSSDVSPAASSASGSSSAASSGSSAPAAGPGLSAIRAARPRKNAMNHDTKYPTEIADAVQYIKNFNTRKDYAKFRKAKVDLGELKELDEYSDACKKTWKQYFYDLKDAKFPEAS